MNKLLVTGIILAAALQAQWVTYRDPAVPRTKDGKPNLAAPAPRVNGKPDLSGLWQVDPSPIEDLRAMFGKDLETFSVPGDDARSFSKYVVDILADVKPEDEPLRPEAAKILQERAPLFGRDITTSRCLPAGITFGDLLPGAIKIFQTPGATLVLYEGDGTHRQIYTDGRKHPANPDPLWLGYSVGKWDGDTFVVDTIGLNDKTWLDGLGHPHSESLHLTERFHRRDFGHMDLQITVDDPKMYTRVFTIKVSYHLLPDTDIIESFCQENEKDLSHIAVK